MSAQGDVTSDMPSRAAGEKPAEAATRYFAGPMKLRSVLFAGAAFTLVAAGLYAFLLEAFYMCQDVPFIDDWAFVHFLDAFINHQIGWQYFLTPHNGHPFLLARTAVYLDWRIVSLDFALLRWCTVIVILATAVLFGARLAFDLVETGIRQRAEAILLAAPLFALTLTLGQWEILSVATCTDNVAVNLLFLLGVVLLDRWVRTDRIVFLITAILAAILCSMTVLEGVLIWPAFTGFLLLGGWSRHRLMSASFLVVFLGFAALTLTRVSTETFVLAPLSVLWGNLILAGSAYVGQIHNHSILSLNAAVGVLVWTLTAVAGMVYWRAPTALRSRMNKYAVLLGLGIGTSLMIEIGRLYASVETMAASRYITAVMPWAWGLYGVLTLGIRSSYWAAAAAGLQIALVVVGVAAADFEELQNAPYRRDVSLHEMQVLREGKDLDSRSVLGSVFYMDRPTGYLVAAGRAFLFENRLSLFRPQAYDAASSH